MPTYRDEAVVLRTQQLGEADRIVTLLSRRHGKIRAVARGVRRSSSKFGGRLEPFNHVDIQFATGRGSLEVVAQVEAIRASRLGGDYTRFTAGQVLVETADRLVSEEGSPAQQQFLLLAGALWALEHNRYPAALIVDSYLLRSLALAGYGVALGECGGCGDHIVGWFSPREGSVSCSNCRPFEAERLSEAERTHLGALIAGDWPNACAAELAVARRVDQLVVSYATWHLDRALRSLPYFER
ncbi:DNA repair protein RecO [Tessaracoccus sp. OH4464_COT-324]|uniref:DNA repair protein RecO n=1 Tax=Tessaracoccus sp. OH4464_COT-324 TaxID=2491059 RepID=UPI000F6448CD|nr:DNA repair protein RecO [Tessaracoccus sp. OH4464_COT-324]RRD47832.1 DNA repair protein RecO [Tessaracoccus sp. OH4464_COT-324]